MKYFTNCIAYWINHSFKGSVIKTVSYVYSKQNSILT